jgi:hypothetical protein
LSRILFVWRRVERVWQAPVEMPHDKQALAFRPYVGKSTPQFIHDSLVVADGKNLPEKRRKAEMSGTDPQTGNPGSAGLTACATLKWAVLALAC